MSFSKLEVVLRLINEEEKQAALVFKAAQEDYESAENALNQALTYRAEYQELSVGSRPSKFPLLQLKAARSFLSNIDGLIESQRKTLRVKDEELEVRRRHWQVLRAKTKSIEAVIASRKASHLLAEEKTEQRRLDDLFVRGMPH